LPEQKAVGCGNMKNPCHHGFGENIECHRISTIRTILGALLFNMAEFQRPEL